MAFRSKSTMNQIKLLCKSSHSKLIHSFHSLGMVTSKEHFITGLNGTTTGKNGMNRKNGMNGKNIENCFLLTHACNHNHSSYLSTICNQGNILPSLSSHNYKNSGNYFLKPGSNNSLNLGNNSLIVRGFKLSTIHQDIFKVQDETDFKEKVLQSKIPVIVDFYATWCGPCKLLTPRLEMIIGSKKGSINLAMVDIDEQEDLAVKYNVSSIPSVMVFKGGQVSDSFLGLKDDDQIRAFVDKAIGNP